MIDFRRWTDEEADAKLKAILQAHNSEPCPHCQKPIDRGDVAWNSASTKAGTGYSVLEIQCQRCLYEIAYVKSWYSGIHDFNEFVYVLGEDWE